jgi:ATP-dependent Clp protease adaptor protein ClpS
MTYTEIEELTIKKTHKSSKYMLLLHNDDFNTFDFVIESLKELCGHTTEQAEQCTLLIHYKGKCDVKRGTVKELRPIFEAFCERGITASIEE